MSLFTGVKKIDQKLALYESRRKLEIDEQLSEYRRREKNHALADVKDFQDSRVEIARQREADHKTYSAEKQKREEELAKLDGEIVARKAVEETQRIHRKLTEDARKERHEAELAGKEEVIAEKDKHIKHLEATIEKLLDGGIKVIESSVKGLGDAAGKDHSTKVIGLGHSIDNDAKTKK